MATKKLTIHLPDALHKALVAQARKDGWVRYDGSVSLGPFARAILGAYVGQDFDDELPKGLGSSTPEKRAEISKAGVAARWKKNPENP